MSDRSSLLSVRLPEDVRARLDQAAKLTRRSRGFIVKEALEKHLDETIRQDPDAVRKSSLEKLRAIQGAGVRLYGGRSVQEIDAMIDEIRGEIPSKVSGKVSGKA